jgi:bifunctional UDP-N-acetylglucosamine pyrophosphorylase/glucosamine-1-phosphate N-acetyltransferase
MSTAIIILAAGKGTRMNSNMPKVLHRFHGKPFVQNVCENARAVADAVIVVVGFRSEEVAAVLPSDVIIAYQEQQLGTGDAVKEALRMFPDSFDTILVISADHPQLQKETLQELLRVHRLQPFPLTFASVILSDFSEWRSSFAHAGRILRGENGFVRRIVEYKHGSKVERAINEVNVSLYVFNGSWLRTHIDQLQKHDSVDEIYITDMIEMAVTKSGGATAIPLNDARQGLGVNSQDELRVLEEIYPQ